LPAGPPPPVLPAAAEPVLQPVYEPGYDGPPRFQGAPRGHGDIPQDELSSYPYEPPGTPPPVSAPQASAPVSALPPGALPPGGYEGAPAPRRAVTGPVHPAAGFTPRPGTGSMPAPGPRHRARHGIAPRARPGTRAPARY